MNMYKKISAVLSVFALLCVNELKAQLYIGVEGGANRNYLFLNINLHMDIL